LDQILDNRSGLGLSDFIDNSVSRIGSGGSSGGLGSNNNINGKFGFVLFNSDSSDLGGSKFRVDQFGGIRGNVGKGSSVDFSGAGGLVVEEPVVKAVSGAKGISSVSGHASSAFSAPSANVAVQTFVTRQIGAKLDLGVIFIISLAVSGVVKIFGGIGNSHLFGSSFRSKDSQSSGGFFLFSLDGSFSSSLFFGCSVFLRSFNFLVFFVFVVLFLGFSVFFRGFFNFLVFFVFVVLFLGFSVFFRGFFNFLLFFVFIVLFLGFSVFIRGFFNFLLFFVFIVLFLGLGSFNTFFFFLFNFGSCFNFSFHRGSFLGGLNGSLFLSDIKRGSQDNQS